MDYRIEQLRYQLREDPSSRMFYQLGELLRREGENAEAVEVLQRGLEAHPKYVAAWVSLGRVLLSEEQYREAESAFAQALDLDQQNAVAARMIGETASERGDWSRAKKALQLARALSPRDAGLEEQLAMVSARLAEEGGENAAQPTNGPPTPTVFALAEGTTVFAEDEVPAEPAREQAAADVFEEEPPAETPEESPEDEEGVGEALAEEAVAEADEVAAADEEGVEPFAAEAASEVEEPPPADEPAEEMVEAAEVEADEDGAKPFLEAPVDDVPEEVEAEPEAVTVATVPLRVPPPPPPRFDVLGDLEEDPFSSEPAGDTGVWAMGDDVFGEPPEASEPEPEAGPFAAEELAPPDEHPIAEPVEAEPPPPAREAEPLADETEVAAEAEAVWAPEPIEEPPATEPMPFEDEAPGAEDAEAIEAQEERLAETVVGPLPMPVPPPEAIVPPEPEPEPALMAESLPEFEEEPAREAIAEPAPFLEPEPELAPEMLPEAVPLPEAESAEEAELAPEMLAEAVPLPEAEEAEEAEEAITADGDMDIPLPTLTLARLALQQGDRELAQRTVTRVLERSPDDAEALELLRSMQVEEAPAQAKIAALQAWLGRMRQAAERRAP